MPFFGAHMSIAGGLHLAFDRAASVRADALQIFTRNQRQWSAPELTDEAVSLFKRAGAEMGNIPIASHASYLVNPASDKADLVKKSIDVVADELRRAERLSIPFLIIHPGSHGGQGIGSGIESFSRNLDISLELSKTERVMVLVENTAGQGTGLGSRFEEIARIIGMSRFPRRLGMCFDTSHAFGAGYELRTRNGYEETFSALDKSVGLEKLRFFHVNDSKKGLGSRVDRHWHIGKGEIGLEGFKFLVNDPRFQSHPMVLETPKGKDLEEDRMNLKVLRSLVRAVSHE